MLLLGRLLLLLGWPVAVANVVVSCDVLGLVNPIKWRTPQK